MHVTHRGRILAVVVRLRQQTVVHAPDRVPLLPGQQTIGLQPPVHQMRVRVDLRPVPAIRLRLGRAILHIRVLRDRPAIHMQTTRYLRARHSLPVESPDILHNGHRYRHVPFLPERRPAATGRIKTDWQLGNIQAAAPMPLTSPGNDDDTGENHQPTLRKNTAEPVEQTLKQNKPEDGQRLPSCGVEDGRRHRPPGRGTRQGVDALAVRRPHRDRRGRDELQEGPHVPDRGRRPRAASGDLGARRGRWGRVRPVLQGVDARTARLHQDRHRRRGPLDRLVRRPVVPERRTRIGRLPHRQLDDRRLGQGQETPVEPGEARRRREDREAHARRQVRRPEEPGRPDRQAVRDARHHQEHGPQGPALPRLAAQGTIEDPAQAPDRTGQGRVEPLGVLGVPLAHPRDRRTRQKDPAAPPRHPQDHRAGLLQRQARGVQQQDQGHHPHGLRIPPREQSHRPDHAPLRRTRHTPTTTKNLTHENSRSLAKNRALSQKQAGKSFLGSLSRRLEICGQLGACELKPGNNDSNQ